MLFIEVLWVLLLITLQTVFAWKCAWGLQCFRHFKEEKKVGGGCESHCNNDCNAITFDRAEQVCFYFNPSWDRCKSNFEKSADGTIRYWTCLKNYDCGHQEVSPKTVSGTITPEPNSWPWHVKIVDSDNSTINGVLISNGHVLTKNGIFTSLLKAHVIVDIDTENLRVNVVASRVSPDDSGLVILTLERFVENSRNIQPICINPTVSLKPNDECYMLNFREKKLSQTQIRLANTCHETYANYNGNEDFCVQSTDNNVDKSFGAFTVPLYCFQDSKWNLYGMAKRYTNSKAVNVTAVFHKLTQYSSHLNFFIQAVYDSQTTVPSITSPTGHQCGAPDREPLRDLREGSPEMRIAHGTDAFPHSWPWQAAIYRDIGDESFQYICGGTLIGSSHVLTAAHCKLFSKNPNDYKVVLGAHNINDKAEKRLESKVRNFTEADGNSFNKNIFPKDLAILTLEIKVTFTEVISPVCLPTSDKNLVNGTLCYVVGWGRNEKQTNLLQQGGVLIRSDCAAIYKNRYDDSIMICAGDQRVDTCHGDSGGPLVCELDGRWYVYGVTSFGAENCGDGKSAVYSKVAGYREWILKLIT